MTRASKALTVAVVAALGLWGCAQGSNAENAAHVEQLEKDCARLKDDYRAVANARDRLRQQVVDMEAERTQLQKDVEGHQALTKEHQTLTKERDELVQQVSARTTERDAVQGQLEQVRKGLRTLLGQTEAAIGTPAPAPSLSVTAPPSGDKS
jgi:uncharacterized coiled-coil DUF342 family protein